MYIPYYSASSHDYLARNVHNYLLKVGKYWRKSKGYDFLHWHTPNELADSEEIRLEQASVGLLGGVPDLCIVFGTKNGMRMLFIELKTQNYGFLSLTQEIFKERIESIGGYFAICYSRQDVKRAIQNTYNALPKENYHALLEENKKLRSEKLRLQKEERKRFNYPPTYPQTQSRLKSDRRKPMVFAWFILFAVILITAVYYHNMLFAVIRQLEPLVVAVHFNTFKDMLTGLF